MYDLIVIGSGPAGYEAIAQAGSLGKKALLVEKDQLGGTCLNHGCIPTKAFLHSAKLFDHARSSAAFGVTATDVRFDWAAMAAHTAKTQATLRAGIATLVKGAKADHVTGTAEILDPRTVRVADTTYQTENILVCTGSRPALPPIPGLAGNPAVIDSSALLARTEPPKSIIIIGGGVIGTEMAFFHALLGIPTTVIEMLPQLCTYADREIGMSLAKVLQTKGAAVHTGAQVTSVDGGTVHFKDKQGAQQSVQAEVVLCAVGRAPNMAGWGAQNIGIASDARHIEVDDHGRTSVPGVWAAGDVTGQFLLAHFAARQAVSAVNTMFGTPDPCRTNAVPSVIYTAPEAAAVGLTEAQAKEQGVFGRSAKVLMGASGRFLAETDGERGFFKAVLGKDGALLGLHIYGPYASEMIAAGCLLLERAIRPADLHGLILPHPTVGELIKKVIGA